MQNENRRKKLGVKLKKAREKMGVTQAEVAEKVGLQVNYYARLERGEENTTIDRLEKIFEVLKIKPLL
jgi:transcriptional regulator with XRE-family HTH domain